MSAVRQRTLAARSQRPLARAVGEIVLCLVGLQAARAVISLALASALPPGDDVERFQAQNAVAFILVGLAALAVARPTSAALGLTWAAASRMERLWYLAIGALLALMLAASLILNPGQAGIGLHFALIVPAFEELLLRGYVWERLASAAPSGQAGLVAWLGTACLFSLWHLGYADTLARHPAGLDLAVSLQWKLAIGAALGLGTGFLRWRTGRIVAPFLLHAFWNLLAP